jgi:hypothetical protein
MTKRDKNATTRFILNDKSGNDTTKTETTNHKNTEGSLYCQQNLTNASISL